MKIEVNYLSSKEMIADGLTKPKPTLTYKTEELRLLGVQLLPMTSQEGVSE
jgi:hypothetical protein